MELITEKELRMLESICEQAQSHDWFYFPGNGKSHRTHIGYKMISSEGVTVNIPLFESNTNAHRADILVAIYAKNYLPLLLRELRRSQQSISAPVADTH